MGKSDDRPVAGVLRLWRRFRVHLAPVRGRVALTAALALLSPFVAASLLWLVKYLVDDVLVAGRLDLLAGMAAVYVLVVAGKFTLDYAATRLESAAAEQLVQDIRTALLGHLISVSPGALGNRSTGDLLGHLSGDVERTEDLVYAAPLRTLADLVGVTFFGGFLILLSWKLTLLSLVAVPPLVLISRHYGSRVRRAATIARRQASAWLAHAEERLGAAMLIQALGTESEEAARFGARCAASRRAELRVVAIQASMSVLIDTAVFVGGLAVLSVGAYEIRHDGITLGTLVAFLGSVGSLYEPARSLARMTARFHRSAAGAQRVAALLDTPSLVTERARTIAMRAPVMGAIDIRNLHFSYRGGPPVLRDVSLAVAPGETVAIVGPSGSGKSTLVRLLLRLHDPTAGAILIDGRDIRDLPLRTVRAAISPVFQDPFLFRGSIRENIRYGEPAASRDAVLAAARAAHVDDFAAALRDGLGAAVGPRGTSLSGGQRQRVALARALLRAAPILVLDEATGSIDSETEELIQEAVERLAGHRTILVIGHRLSSLSRADRVVVLDQGRIVESGAPAALLRSGTRYYALFAAQTALGPVPG
jgi:ABC-type multidrug transport system fused ATPase/permease subunit